MKTVILIFAWLLVVTIQLAGGVQPPFQFFKLAVQWPRGYCYRNTKCLRTPDIFTIHGLWPSNFTGPTVENCPSTTNFATFTRPSYVASLDSKWMNLVEAQVRAGDKDDQWWWEYEWKKHGTCSETLYKQTPYFNLGVNLYDQYNLTTIFQTNGITRGQFHPLSSMTLAIFIATRSQPEIRCVHKNVLLEVVICWDPLGKKPINCPLVTNCVQIGKAPGINVFFP